LTQAMDDRIRIVPITANHIKGFHACLDVVAREKRYLASTEAPPLETTRSFVKGNIKNNIPQFVALDGNKVVGWCDISPKGRASMAHCGVLGMGVHPAYRRQGIGRRLLEATLARAIEIGLKRVELDVIVSNSAAIALYTQFGFMVEGIKKQALRLEDRYLDLMFMALWVGS